MILDDDFKNKAEPNHEQAGIELGLNQAETVSL